MISIISSSKYHWVLSVSPYLFNLLYAPLAHTFTLLYFLWPKIHFKYQTKLRGRRRGGGGGREGRNKNKKSLYHQKVLWPLVYVGIERHGLVDIGVIG